MGCLFQAAGEDATGGTLLAVRSFQRQDEYFAVAHTSGSGGSNDCADQLFNVAVLKPDGNLHLGQISQRVLASPVFVQIAFLAAVTFDFANLAAFDGQSGDGLKDLFGHEWSDDSYNLFHAFTLPCSLSPVKSAGGHWLYSGRLPVANVVL